MRIVGVIASMQAGGAERVMGLLASHLANSENEVSIFTYEKANSRPFYGLDVKVRYQPLGLAKSSSGIVAKIKNNILRFKTLRRAIVKANPDLVISFCVETNVMVLAATRRLNIRIIVSERVEPALYKIGMAWSIGRRIFYPFAQCIVVQSRSALNFFPVSLKKKSTIIPNPVPKVPNSGQFPRRAKILAVGRLTDQKGFDILITSFAQLHARHPDWKLRIVGEGEQRHQLEKLISIQNMTGSIEMPGQVRDMAQEYAEASVFVLSSRFEGFPNALCEAMAAGLPAVAVACSGGVTEIISNANGGTLVPNGNTAALTDAINTMLLDPFLRQKSGENARQRISMFSPELVWPQWDRCIEQAQRRSSKC